MYSRLQLARKYIRYYLTASNSKGHGIHSPFVFDFVRHVLNDSKDYPAYSRIERLRKQLKSDPTVLTIKDLGAGSAAPWASGALPVMKNEGIQTRHRTISNLARHSAKPARLGQLLFRIAEHYRPGKMLELGTSLGLSSSYLASACPDSTLWTIEGSSEVAAAAEKNFRSLGLENIRLIQGDFDKILAPLLFEMGSVDLAFIDGNHRREPTLRYFNALMERIVPSSILVFDDIHWSREMEEAWMQIRSDKRVGLTIDLFFIGLVFFREEFKVKQDFVIRY